MKNENYENELKLISAVVYCQLKYSVQFIQSNWGRLDIFHTNKKLDNETYENVIGFLMYLTLGDGVADIAPSQPSIAGISVVDFLIRKKTDHLINSLKSLAKLETNFIPWLTNSMLFDSNKYASPLMEKERKSEEKLIKRVEKSLAEKSGANFYSDIINIVVAYCTIFSPSKEYKKSIKYIKQSLGNTEKSGASFPKEIVSIVVDYYRIFPSPKPKNKKTTKPSTNQVTMAPKYSQNG